MMKRLLNIFKFLTPNTWLKKTKLSNKLLYYTVIFGIFLVAIPVILYQFSKPTRSEAAWFNDNWIYRQLITVTVPSNGSNINNLETLLTINTSTLITNGKLQSSCQDLRFISQTGKNLPYYIDSGCNTTTTKVWILVDTVPANTTSYSLYMYYGNPSAVSKSDQNKFNLFNGLVGYFTLNDGTGGTTVDSSAQGNTGTISIGASGTQTTTTEAWTNGASGQYASGLNFDGTDDKVSVSTNAAQLTTGMTLSTWIKPTAGGSTQNILDNSNPWSYRLYRSGTTLSLQLSTNGTNNGYHSIASALTASVWQHVVAVFNGTNIILYVNGQQVLSEAAGTTTIQSPSAGWVLGSYGTGEYYSGVIDDSRIYNRALSASEIGQLYQNPGVIATTATTNSQPTTAFATEEQAPGPIAYWKFDEGTGTQVNDSSSNKYTGTINGGATWKQGSDCLSGKCLYFDGVDGYINLGASSRYGATATTGSYTVEAWVKPTDVSRYNVVTRYLGGGDYFSAGATGSTGYLRNMVKDTTNNVNFWPDTGGAAIQANTWSHITFVFQTGVGYKYYVNGKLKRSVSNTDIHFFNYAATAYIGIGTDASSYFKGYIDEVKVYAYERTAPQVQLDFTSRGSVKGVALQAGGTETSALSNGLVAYWKMDESSWNGTSGEVVDSSGNSNNGTSVLGAEASPSAKFGNSGYFAGSDEAISVADSVSLDLGDTLTISLWAKRGTIGVNNYIMQKGAGPYAIGFNASNQLYLDMPGTGNIFTSTAAFTDTSSFHHIVFAKKGSSLLVYFDGTVVPGTFTNRTLTDNASALYLGSNSGNTSTRYAGNMDEVRLYNRQLTPDEIQQLYNFAPGPYAYLSFDDGSGSSIADKSGNGYGGTWNGSGSNRWRNGKYGKAGYFDGTTDYVSFSSLPNPSTNGPITIEMWVNSVSATPVGIFDSAPGVANVLRNYSAGNVEWWNSSPSVALGLSANTWTHIAFTFEFSSGTTRTLKYYKNGVLQSSSSTGVTPTYAWTTFRLGNINGGSAGWYTGLIDEFKIYNYARTPGQIISDMNGGHPLGGSPVGSQIGYWKFDEGYGTIANNSGNGGSALKGTLTNMASPPTATSGWQQTGKFGKALGFNKGTTYVDMGNPTALQITSDLTISAWIYPSLFSNNGGIASKYYNTVGNRGYNFGVNSSGQLAFRASVDGTATVDTASTHTVPLNSWTYVSVVYNAAAGTASYYINGKLDKTATGLPNSLYNPPSRNFQIGAWDSGATGANLFAGLIDEVKIYNAALSDSEIRIDYNHGSSLVLGATSDTSGLTGGSVASNSASAAYCVPGDTSTCSAPVGEWNFDEHQGISANDTSGNGRTGTLTSGPSWTQGKVGSGISFDGSDDYVSLANGVDISSGDWTMQAWIYPTAYGAQWRHVFGAETQTFAFGIASGSLDVTDVSIADCTVSSITPSLNTWSHIAASFVDSSNTLTYYVNGIKANSVTCNVTPTGGKLTRYLGRSLAYTSAFLGKIDEPRIYTYVRTPAQIAYDYNRGKPVTWYKMDECQGSILNESMGSTMSATITIGGGGTQTSVGTCSTASTAWGNGATGKFNYSLNFDGTDDFATIIDNSALQMTSNITVSLWVKPTTLNGQLVNYPISKGVGGGAAQGWAFGINGSYTGGCTAVGQIYVFTNNTFICSPTTNVISTGSWQHMVFTNDGTNTKLYINGQLVKTGAQTLVSSANYQINIGRRTDASWYFKGGIDDVQVFNYALTATQVKALMNQSSSVRFGPNTGAP